MRSNTVREILKRRGLDLPRFTNNEDIGWIKTRSDANQQTNETSNTWIEIYVVVHTSMASGGS